MNHPGWTICAEPSWGECLHRMARCLLVPVSSRIPPDKNKGIRTYSEIFLTDVVSGGMRAGMPCSPPESGKSS